MTLLFSKIFSIKIMKNIIRPGLGIWMSFPAAHPSLWSNLTSVHEYWKNHIFDYTDHCHQVMSLLFNTLSRFVIAFLPRNRHLLISWLQSLSTVILETKKIKSATVSTSVQFSHSVVSDSLRPNGLQHTRPACPSPTSGVYSNSCPLSPWCHPTISSCFPFSFCLQSFPASGLFQWVNSSHEVAKVLEFQFQHQSFQWPLRTDLL